MPNASAPSPEESPEPAALRFQIQPQPDDTTCGPTCLQAVYHHFGDPIALGEVIAETPTLPQGGTLAVMLGCHALRRGYRAALYTFNLNIFDPTWFSDTAAPAARRQRLMEKLQTQAKVKRDKKLKTATASYLEFLTLGGEVRFEDLRSRLLLRFLRRGLPVLTGLSSTYLYRAMREFGPNDEDDDLRGTPSGHFVIIHGINPKTRRVRIADPLANNPGFGVQAYEVDMSRLIGAIMLGVLTYDANLLVIEPAAPPSSKAIRP